MDARKVALIEQFLEQKSVEEWFSGEVLRYLPTPYLLPPHLKKALFLRRLSADLSLSLLSLDTLDLLELLEELDRSLGVTSPLPPLSSAYCALAAELTLAPLRRPDGEAAFLEAAHWIWDCRVTDLEMSEARGLVGEGLREWRAAIMEAVGNKEAREALPQRDTRRDAVEAVREYLRVAVSEMGGPMLDLLAKAAGVEEDIAGGTGKGVVAGGGEDGDRSRGKSVALAGNSGVRLEMSIPTGAPAEELGQMGCHALAISAEAQRHVPETEANVRNVLTGRIEDAITDQLSEKLPLPSSVEVNKVKEALKSSCEELRKVVRDPLPDALERAADVQVSMVEGSANPNDANGNQNQTGATELEPSAQEDQETVTQMLVAEHRNRIPSPREVQHNVIDGGEDSSECPTGKSTNNIKRTRLSTRNRGTSPSTPQEVSNFVRRRKIKRWTPQEEDALREAVKKLGKGNWKFILQCYPGTFEDRTEIDLKDKWRNMTR